MTLAASERRRIGIPLAALSIAAWVLLVIRQNGGGIVGNCCVSLPMQEAFSTRSLRLIFWLNPPVALLSSWVLMILAMMAPMLSSPIGHLYRRSLRSYRPWLIAVFVGSYVSAWLVVGVFFLLVAILTFPATQSPVVGFMIGLVLAVLWQCSPWKQSCLNRRHTSLRIPSFGAKAFLGAAQFGFTQAWWCIGSCWALMFLAETWQKGHLVAMAAVTLWLLAEHLDRPAKPTWTTRIPQSGLRFIQYWAGRIVDSAPRKILSIIQPKSNFQNERT